MLKLFQGRTHSSDSPKASLYPKHERLTFNQAARELLGETEAVLVYTDSDLKDRIWLKACGIEEPGAKKLIGKDSKFIYVKALRRGLDWKEYDTTVSLNVAYDPEQEMVVVR